MRMGLIKKRLDSFKNLLCIFNKHFEPDSIITKIIYYYIYLSHLKFLNRSFFDSFIQFWLN